VRIPFTSTSVAACAVVTAAAIAVPALATPPDIYVPAENSRASAPRHATGIDLTAATGDLPAGPITVSVPASMFDTLARITVDHANSSAPQPQSATAAARTPVSSPSADAPPATDTVGDSAVGTARTADVRAAAFPPIRDAIIAGYNVIVPFVDYGVDLAQYAVGFVPYAGRFAPQVGIFYYTLIRPVATSFIFNGADVLAGGNFGQAVVNVVNDSINAGVGFANAQIDFALGFLPPLPFAATKATPAAVTDRTAPAQEDGESDRSDAPTGTPTRAEKPRTPSESLSKIAAVDKTTTSTDITTDVAPADDSAESPAAVEVPATKPGVQKDPVKESRPSKESERKPRADRGTAGAKAATDTDSTPSTDNDRHQTGSTKPKPAADTTKNTSDKNAAGGKTDGGKSGDGAGSDHGKRE
jgi:hypothetical protein